MTGGVEGAEREKNKGLFFFTSFYFFFYFFFYIMYSLPKYKNPYGALAMT